MPRKPKNQSLLQSPTGMDDIFEPDYFAYQGLFEKASEIALYYGFKPIETPILEGEELLTKCLGENTDLVEKELYTLKAKGSNKLTVRPEGRIGVVRSYMQHEMVKQPQPIMLYHYGSYLKHTKMKDEAKREKKQFGLEILGTSKSVADATIIRIMLTILEESGFKNLCVHVNSLGDIESQKIYTKELTSFVKKHISDLSPAGRQLLKNNPLQLLGHEDPKTQKILEEAPDPMSSLNAPSKKHLKEVLEYLDAMEVPYEINPHLVHETEYYSQTLFRIVDQQEVCSTNREGEEETHIKNEQLAIGGRYDTALKKIGIRKELPGVGATLEFDAIISSKNHKRFDPRIIRKPKVYFIQLGFEAKLKSLTVVETLRKARVPITQSLAKDKLAGQLAVAERLEIPYAIILGQREALDNTVIVRNMKNHSQEIVPIDDLPGYIKKNIK